MTLLGLLAILFSIAVSIALATMEAAFYLVKRRNLHKIADEDSPELAKLSHYFEDPPSMLMPIHIGTYTAHVAMTVLVTVLLLDLLSHWAMLVALVTMFIYLLIFRLTLPYAIARRGPERVLLTLIRPVHRYARLLLPLTTLLRRRASGRCLAVAKRILTPPDRYAYEMPVCKTCVRCGGNRVALDRRLECLAGRQKIFARQSVH